MFAADQTELEAKKADADAVIVESLIIDRPMHAAVQRLALVQKFGTITTNIDLAAREAAFRNDAEESPHGSALRPAEAARLRHLVISTRMRSRSASGVVGSGSACPCSKAYQVWESVWRWRSRLTMFD